MKKNQVILKTILFVFMLHISLTGFAQSPGGVSSNLTLWLKADNASTLTGNPVQTWSTSGGSALGYNVTQATSANRPALVNGATTYTKYNYNPRVKFNQTAVTWLENTATSPDLLNTNGAAIVVINQDNIGITAFTYYSDPSYRYQLKPGFRFQTGSLGTGYTFDWAAPTEYSTTSASIVSNYGCGATMQLRKNSVQTNIPSNNAALYDPSINPGLCLGGNGPFSEPSDAGIAEVIFFSNKPTIAEMDRVETYLAVKYGITRGGNTNTSATYNYVASNGTTILWDKTSNAGYNNDIAVIGRDDNSSLNQKQSISVNNGEAVTIATGNSAIATENSTNPNTFISNNAFLAWGNNGLATTFNPGANKPTGILARLNRVWKSQITNFSQQAIFGFESTQITGLGAIGTLCLLFDDDGDFSNATVSGACAAINPTGNRLEFTGITIPPGKPYFTLARVVVPTLISNNSPICSGTTLVLTSQNIANATYSWTGPNSFVSAVSIDSIVNVTTTSAGTFSVSINNYGCITNLSTTAIINTSVIPTATITLTTGTNPMCAGASVTFMATPSNGGTTPTYQWQVNGLNAGTNSNTFTSGTLSNNDAVTVILTSSASCASPSTVSSNTITMSVNGMLAPSVVVSASTTAICTGTSVTFTATPSNGGTTPTYQWQVNGINAGTNSNTFTSGTLSNNDVVTVILASNASCASLSTVSSNTVTMFVNAVLVPSVVISASGTSICTGTSVTFTASPSNGGTTPTYQWQVNGINAGANSNTFASGTLSNNDVVTVILTSSASCASPLTVSSNTITMSVNAVLVPSVVISASGTSICAGTSVTFTASPSNGGTTPTYQWQINGINAGTNSSTFTSSTLSNNDAVTVILTSNTLCVSPATVTSNTIAITVTPVLVPSIIVSASGTSICAGTPVTFTATPSNGGTSPTYQWQVNGINAGTNSSTFTSSTLTNNAVVTAVLTSNATCASPTIISSGGIIMNVASVPHAIFSYNPIQPTEIEPMVSFQNQSTSSVNWLWNFGNGIDFSTSQNPNYSFPAPGNYTVTLTATNGPCIDSVSEVIHVQPFSTYYIPNTFTPNGDGINDGFYLVGKGISKEDYKMSIYNRWGELIFYTEDLMMSWDGTTRGVAVPDGVYVCIFNFRLNSKPNEIIEKIGNVSLFR